MNSITTRFIESYKTLLNQEKIASAKEFTRIIEANSSLMSDLMNNRTNVGINAVKNLSVKFNIDPNWILTGQGSMFFSSDETKESDVILNYENTDMAETTNTEKEFNLRERIKFFCKKNSMTIRDLAKAIDMNEGNIYQRFNKNSMELEHLTKIAKVFNVQIEELISKNVTSDNKIVYSVASKNSTQHIQISTNEDPKHDIERLKAENTNLKELLQLQRDKIQALEESNEHLKKIISLIEKN